MNAQPEQHSNYKILKNENLIIEYYYGEVTKDVIFDMNINIINDSEYNPKYNSIVDFRDSVMNINQTEIINVIDFVYDNVKYNSSRKVAFLTNTPSHVVFTTIFTVLSNKYQQHIKYFQHYMQAYLG